MATKYEQVVNLDGVIIAVRRLNDGVGIPVDETNIDYAQYLADIQKDPTIAVEVLQYPKETK